MKGLCFLANESNFPKGEETVKREREMKDAGFGKESRFQLLCDQRLSDLALAQLIILFPSSCC